MADIILSTDKLYKRYGTTNAVYDINFALEKGTIHAIIGANGAGKSTFVKLLFGEELPTSGKIFLSGSEYKPASPADALKNKIAMVSQDFGLISSMTIAENLSLIYGKFKKFWHFNPQKSKIYAEMILSKLSLKFDVNRLIDDLSVSEKQLISIAKAFSSESDILIFDEPTSVLDSDAIEKIRELILNLKNSGKSVIYITHKIKEVFELADFVTVLSQGRVVLSSSTNEVSKADILKYFNIIFSNPIVHVPNKPIHPFYRVDNLSTKSLRNISFSISKGETLGIISDNYNQVTELVRTLYGVNKKLSGTIRINNVIVNSSPSKNVELKIGFITDDRRIDGVFNNLDINDNIGLLQFKKVSRHGMINSRVIIKNTKEKVRQLGIKCRSVFQSAMELSGGNQQKVLFARWMSFDFELLILLEPTSGIDLGGKSDMHHIISIMKKQGKSFLVVSSNFDEVKNFCDRVMFIEDGVLNFNSAATN